MSEMSEHEIRYSLEYIADEVRHVVVFRDMPEALKDAVIAKLEHAANEILALGIPATGGAEST